MPDDAGDSLMLDEPRLRPLSVAEASTFVGGELNHAYTRPDPPTVLLTLDSDGAAIAAVGTPSAASSRRGPSPVAAVTDRAYVRPFSSPVKVAFGEVVVTLPSGALVTVYDVAPTTAGHEMPSDPSPLTTVGAGRDASATAAAIASAATASTSPAP